MSATKNELNNSQLKNIVGGNNDNIHYIYSPGNYVQDNYRQDKVIYQIIGYAGEYNGIPCYESIIKSIPLSLITEWKVGDNKVIIECDVEAYKGSTDNI